MGGGAAGGFSGGGGPQINDDEMAQMQAMQDELNIRKADSQRE